MLIFPDLPHGITSVLFLAESHIMISTRPEYGYALVEIYFYNPKKDIRKASDVLLKKCSPPRHHIQKVSHEI